MGVVRRENEIRVEVPDATVRLVAAVTSVEAIGTHGGLAFAYAGPRRVEVQRSDGRRYTARIRDVDRWARCAMLVLGAVAFGIGRRRRGRNQ